MTRKSMTAGDGRDGPAPRAAPGVDPRKEAERRIKPERLAPMNVTGEPGPVERKKLGEMLIEAGLLTPEQLAQAIAEQQRSPAPLGVKLVTMGLVSELDLLLTLSSQMDAPAAQIEGRRVPRELIRMLPMDLAVRYSCIPLLLRSEGGRREMFLGMSDPTDTAALEAISRRVGCRVRPALVMHGQLLAAIERHYLEKPGPRDELLADHAPLDEPEIAEDPPTVSYNEEPSEPDPDTDPTRREVELRPSPLEPSAAARPEPADPATAGTSSRDVLRTLIELLVDHGVIGPNELQERLQQRKPSR